MRNARATYPDDEHIDLRTHIADGSFSRIQLNSENRNSPESILMIQQLPQQYLYVLTNVGTMSTLFVRDSGGSQWVWSWGPVKKLVSEPTDCQSKWRSSRRLQKRCGSSRGTIRFPFGSWRLQRTEPLRNFQGPENSERRLDVGTGMMRGPLCQSFGGRGSGDWEASYWYSWWLEAGLHGDEDRSTDSGRKLGFRSWETWKLTVHNGIFSSGNFSKYIFAEDTGSCHFNDRLVQHFRNRKRFSKVYKAKRSWA